MTIIQAKPLKQFGVFGPASALDNELPVFDGTTGRKIKDGSGIIITAGSKGSAQGQMPFWDNSLSSWVHAETSEMVWDDANKRGGLGITPVSKVHIYEDTTNTGVDAGLTIEQESTGDAVVQFLLTSGQRWVAGIDNSDADKFKIASSVDLNTDVAVTIDPSNNKIGIGTEIEFLSGDDGKITFPAHETPGWPFKQKISFLGGDAGFWTLDDTTHDRVCLVASNGDTMFAMDNSNIYFSKLSYSPTYYGLIRGNASNGWGNIGEYYRPTNTGDWRLKKLTDGRNFELKDWDAVTINTKLGIDVGVIPTASLDINSDILRLRTPKTPASSGAAGNQGDECWDENYNYRWVSTNNCKRTPLSTW